MRTAVIAGFAASTASPVGALIAADVPPESANMALSAPLFIVIVRGGGLLAEMHAVGADAPS